ncbi:MAG: phytanoyl-CoA dioxygenase family protein [Sphingomonadaceae bacterium]|nr:phytanoyl-CoA dioxygenase family protein [Sphingomonadaceae bacterium]
MLAAAPDARPGTRFRPLPGLADAVAPATQLAASVLGPAGRPVRAIPFDKSPRRNWSVGWHQDRTIALRRRIDTPGFASWTVKTGIVHAVPPFALLARLLTLRIHLDPAGPDNAPLLILRGSHLLGRVAEPEMEALAARLETFACEASRGDVWLYATPILHASARALAPGRRRVLQLLYAAEALPNGLDWLGI